MPKELFPVALEIIGPAQGEALHFTMESGLFIMAYDKGKTQSAGIYATASTMQDEGQAYAVLASLLAALAHSGPFSLKLIGDPELAKLADTAAVQLSATVLRRFLQQGRVEILYLPRECRVLVAKTEAAPAAPPPEAAGEARPISVLIVDDSATIREILARILTSDPGLCIVGSLGDPTTVEAFLEHTRPDVITLDIHMPELNGLDLLKSYLPRFAIPTVMVSAASYEDGAVVLKAFELGAVDYIQKPEASQLKEMAPLMIEKIKAAARARIRMPGGRTPATAAATFPPLDPSFLLAIGSSTGGPEALRHILTSLPADIPPTVIVQHIPALFSRTLADRLNETCPFQVKEAADGDVLAAGTVYIAPGGRHMRVATEATGALVIRISDEPPLRHHKPAVDILFQSLLAVTQRPIVGVVLTGMGVDGADGLLQLKKAGALTLAQDEKSSVVFGMPREAIRLGAAEKVCALDDIATQLMQWIRLK